MRISGTGLAHNGINAINKRRKMHMAKSAISAFHDALLAVALGTITPEEVKDFFWKHDLKEAKYYGDVLKFTPDEPDNPEQGMEHRIPDGYNEQ